MDILRAKEIIECLADGVNPLTGRVRGFLPRGRIPTGRTMQTASVPAVGTEAAVFLFPGYSRAFWRLRKVLRYLPLNLK